jgi:hypothetical protein
MSPDAPFFILKVKTMTQKKTCSTSLPSTIEIGCEKTAKRFDKCAPVINDQKPKEPLDTSGLDGNVIRLQQVPEEIIC